MLCGGPERLQFSFFDGACLADEICVNQTGARLAWCVTNINFVKLRNRELGRPIRFRQGYSHALPWPWPITKKTVSAIITDTTGTKSVAANRLEIKAVKRKEIFDAVTYTTLEGGLGTCDIDAVLPDEISEANVYVI
ncbi:hypothetical protein MMC20_007246 [Loxospora ochrophaea]|nr:hypothetical protein [Loxospora ochrophaea]